MLKRLFEVVFTILGGLIGYEVFDVLRITVLDNGAIEYTDGQITVLGVTIVLIFVLIFFRIAPGITRGSKRLADNIESNLTGVSTTKLMGGTIGLICGLAIAYLISGIYGSLISQAPLFLAITISIYSVMAFLGAVIGSRKIGPILDMTVSEIKRVQFTSRDSGERENVFDGKSKKTPRIPKILDTSVIIDGRILEIMKTGFFEGPIIIPEFVLVELRHIADSSDSLKRAKGRRGLDILKRIQEEYGIEIYNTDSEKGLKEIPEVDVKLLKLAQNMKGKVVTNDFNLNKVAQVKNIGVLNINELANAVKPMVIPGEQMTVTLIKQGKDRQQAVAYLEDGTMIVVEEGRKLIGETVDIIVTSVLQTAAGRMIFGKVK